MKIFLATANLDDIRQGLALGVVEGVTTNPALIAREGFPVEEQIRKICGLFEGGVSASVLATDSDGMIYEGRSLARIHSNVIVKVPVTRDGIRACSVLSKEGVRVNVSLCFSAAQALLAANASAYVVSPFVGRLHDLGSDGGQLLRDIVQIYRNYGIRTQVLAASLRTNLHFVEAAKAGADIATIPLKLLDALFHHPLTEQGLRQFQSHSACMVR